MYRALIRISAFASVVLLVSGCGGSSGSSGNSGNGGGNGGGSSTPTAVTFSITGATPTAVAARIGSGAFTAVTPTGTVALTLPAGTTNFAVAFLCPPFVEPSGSSTVTYTSEYVFEASTLDGTSFSEPCPTVAASTLTGSTGLLTGTVDASAIPGNPFVEVVATNGSQSASESSVDGADLNFSLTAPAGSDRVEVYTLNTQNSGALETFNVSAARNFSAQSVPGALNGGTTVVLGAADEVVPQPIAYTNIPEGFSAPTTQVVLQPSGGGGGQLLDGAATASYGALPAGAIQNGDSYLFTSNANMPSISGYESVLVNRIAATGGPLTVAFPAPWSYAGPTPAPLPTFNLSYSDFSGTTGLYDTVSMNWVATPTTEFFVEVTATGNAQGAVTTLSIPDLSGVNGFLAAPASNTQIIWIAEISQGNYSSLGPLPSNASTMAVANDGFYTVP